VRTFLCLCSFVLALALAACGGDDDGGDEPSAATSEEATEQLVDEGPTEAEDVAAIEQVLLAYGAAEGSEACDYYSAEKIEGGWGGIEACRRDTAGLQGVVFKVSEIEVDGDLATAVVSNANGSDPDPYELVREDGEWLINGIGAEELSSPPSSAEQPGLSSAPARDDPEPAPQPSREQANEAHVKRLFGDYATVRGRTVCGLFSERFVDREIGGISKCLRAFADKKPGVVTLQALDFTGPNRGLVIAKLNGDVVNFGVTRTGSPDLPYGRWEIDDIGIPGSG
jgi:hypothetical protein